MSEYNWCHNPDCHKIKTQSRVRGSGNNKVLRTIKIRANKYGNFSIWNYFCNNNCLFSFLHKFGQEIANTYSVKQPSETHNPTHNVAGKFWAGPPQKFYRGTRAGPPQILKTNTQHPLKQKGVPSLPFIV